MKKNKTEKKKFEFSKLIIVFETLMVAYVSYKVLNYAEMCIQLNYLGSLAFLTTMITAVWAAYGTSVTFYYGKAKAENIPKIQHSLELEKHNQTQVKLEVSSSSDVDCDILI